MIEGIYEELVSKLVKQEIDAVDKNRFYISTSVLDKEEASTILAQHLSQTIRYALKTIKGDKQIETQIEIENQRIHPPLS